jgi:hypothetical protein
MPKAAAVCACLLLLSSLAAGQAARNPKKWTGPRPEKPDVPFLLHVDKLIETESGMATEGKSKDGSLYTVPGAGSPVKTPMAEPIFLFQAGKINPERLALFRMEVKGGQRSLLLPEPGKRKKDSARPVFMLVTALDRGLFKIEVNEYLPDGEYCLSPDGSNQVFCFSAQ